MSKKKKIVVAGIICAVLLVAGSITAFFLLNKEQEVIAAAENKYDVDYVSFTSYEQHPDMMVDGVLDEEAWQNKAWYTNTYQNNVSGAMPIVYYTAFPTEYGVYVSALAEDTNLVNDGQYSYNTNSCFMFYAMAFNVGEKAEDCGAYVSTIVVDMKGNVLSNSASMDRAVTVVGELNSGETESATLEMFIPWEEFGIDTKKGIPTEVYLMPKYYGMLDESGATVLLAPYNGSKNKISEYYCFNEDGYTSADAKDCVVGDSKLGTAKNSTWDISQESERIVRSSGGKEYHRIFFSKEYGSNYIVETTIVPVGELASWANAGIYFQGADSTSSEYYAALLPMDDDILVSSVNGTKNFPDYSIRTLTAYPEWTHKLLDVKETSNIKAASQEGVRLSVIKYGAQFYYFIDGKFMACEEISFMDMDVLPGLFAINADAIFKDYFCKEITKDELNSYLNDKNAYSVSVKTNGGGSVAVSDIAVVKGDNYSITFTSKSGYRVSSILINGVEMISDAQTNASEGVYTVKNVTENQEVVVNFEKCETITFDGMVTYEGEGVEATLLFTGISDKALRYEVSASVKKGFNIKIPVGTYQVYIKAEGYKDQVTTVTLNKDTSKDYSVVLSDFGDSVAVNGKTVTSKTNAWDRTKEYSGQLSGSYDSGIGSAPLYFRKTAYNFVVSTTIEYTTTFQDGVEYQPDLMGGFYFTDGTNTAWIVARKKGVTYTGWNYVGGLIDNAVLMQEDQRSVTFTVAKVSDKLYLFFDGVYAGELNWSDVAPNIELTSELAIGLYCKTDKPSDIRFSNWSIQAGKTAATQYVTENKQTKPLSGNAMFADAVLLNGETIKTNSVKWDLSQIQNNIAMGSYELGTNKTPLYFAQTGNTVLLEATMEYTTDFVDGVEYQPDLFGGFYFTDGTNSGWLAANKKGICYTGFNFEDDYVENAVLTYPEARSVKMTLAVKDNEVYVFFDDTYITKKNLSQIIPGVKNNAELAFALYMRTDKEADIRYSNISISTDEDVVNKYISENKK